MIVHPPFTTTDDPRVLGIEPIIPNINEKISAMIQKYRAETIDIKDVDLAFDSLLPSINEVINAPTDKIGNGNCDDDA